MTRNYEYEIWLVSIGAAKGDISKLRAEHAKENGCPEPEPAGTSWYGAITPPMIDRAGGRPSPSHVDRAELIHGTPSPVGFQGGTDYADFLNRGGFRK
jgi:hypothetical protein